MTRKSHSKSRRGCITCKQRRIKCDEEKPTCKKCTSRNAVCTYPSTSSLVWVNRNPVSTGDEGDGIGNGTPPPQYSPKAQEENQSTKVSTLNLENIDLIIHWFTETVHTVNPPTNLAAKEICQTFILNQARKHQFLLHGLLALSALHLADSHSDPEPYTKIATIHHTQGLELYYSILSNINNENYSASIAFASITIMYTFGIAHPRGTKTPGIELIDHLSQIVLLAHGWQSVVDSADRLDRGTGAPVFPAPHVHTGALSTATEAAFARLNDMNHDQDIIVYALAISTLKAVFHSLEEDRENPHIALQWAHTLPKEFVSLLHQRRNLALVIVGHYCIVLDALKEVWWLRGWSKGLFGVILAEVDFACRDVLEWPRQIIGLEE
ncbi:hypothetical protein V495_07738 [Pseudogymnoascus sp. VKM F-4514 (FW-929)]|nr:hypothetical protein V495_07738 [Pseudogymnoascus sp. VKM F-4514 (FW-929)]KFY61728.1 hypothetical protein V497_02759 [Pseudogymnoascus sp. VKM F-4516 (FW-969)]